MAEITLGSRIFKTKQAATSEIRRILHNAELHAHLCDKEFELIAALYARHPRRRLNEAPTGYYVGINSFHGALTRGFQAVFSDGTLDSFSYRPCLTPGAATPSLVAAMRAAIVVSQREVLRGVYWRIRPSIASCWKCKQHVPIEVAEVHHLHPKFRDIADHFVSLIGLPEVEAGLIGDTFVDNVILNRWQHFHDSVAQRVIACAKCNADAERDELVELNDHVAA